jgi:PAS domain S-box-containing protein
MTGRAANILRLSAACVSGMGLWTSLQAAEPTILKVGVHSVEPFIVIRNNGTEVTGLFADVLETIAARKGWQIHYIPDSRHNNLARLEAGQIDLLMPVPAAMQRDGRFDLTQKTLITSWGRVYVAQGGRAQSWSDLAGKTIAVVQNDAYYAGLRGLLNEATVKCEFVEMPDYRAVFEALDRRRVDAGVVDRFFGDQNSATYGVTASFLASPPVEFRFASPRACNRIFTEPVDYWLTLFQADPRSPYYAALKTWTDYGHKPLSPYLPALLALTLLLVSTIGGFLGYRQYRGHTLQAATLNQSAEDLRREIADHEEREQSLESWEHWYQMLFARTRDAVLMHGITPDRMPGNFVEANEQACAWLQYTREELLRLTPRDIESLPDPNSATMRMPDTNPAGGLQTPTRLGRQTGAELIKAIQEKELVSYERVFRTKDGRDIPVEITATLLTHEGKPVIMLTAHDITLRREAQRALQATERMFHDFFARSPTGIALFDSRHKLSDVNPSCLGMFGFSDRVQFAKLDLFTQPEVSDDDRKTLLKGGTVKYETVIDFDDAHQHHRFQSSRSGRCHFDIIMTNLGLDQSFIPKGYLVQVQDITERRKAEEALRQSERHLRQAQKMESIGTLAGGIAHDFNNLLTPIIGYTEMALLSVVATDPIRAQLEEVLKASNRARDLVKQILTFSRQSREELKPIRLSPIISEVRGLLKVRLPPNIELRDNSQSARDIVRADPTQMHSVLMNLCTNAHHAMRDTGGVLEIRMREIRVDSRSRGALTRLKHGIYVDLSIHDTGHGMDRQTMDRIFEPFFTTKGSGEGTGMGLAVVHGIVINMQGIITVESELGKGSAFHLYLPLLEQTMEQKTPESAPLPRGSERILFVDDEPDIITMINQMLSQLGYQTTLCDRSSDALEMFREDPGRFDMLITDQIMPGMTGLELTRELRRIRPDLPVILCTGYSKTVSEEDVADAGVRDMLMKPIALRHLAESIRRALDHQARVPYAPASQAAVGAG